MVAQVECCSISCDQLVSNPWWIEVAVTSSHLAGVLDFWNAGHKWLHFIAIDCLVARLFVMSQSDINRQLVDVEVLLAVARHTGSELVWFLDCCCFSSGHVNNELLKLGCKNAGCLCGWSLPQS